MKKVYLQPITEDFGFYETYLMASSTPHTRSETPLEPGFSAPERLTRMYI